MGRKKRTETVYKTTVYFLESDLNKIDAKNRRRALRIAKEISLRAVSKLANDLETYRNEMTLICRGANDKDFIDTYLKN